MGPVEGSAVSRLRAAAPCASFSEDKVSPASGLAHLLQKVLELEDLLQKDVLMLALDPLRVDVDHVTVEVELDLTAELLLAIEGGARLADQLLGLVHHAHELVPQALLVHLAELGELRGLDGGVQLHVGADPRQELLLLHLLQEELELALVSLVGVEGVRLIKIGRSGRHKLGAGVGEELLEAELLAALQAGLLLRVLVPDRLLQGLVHRPGAQGEADQHERVHLVLLLHHGIVLVRQRVHARGLRQEHADVAERADGVRVAPHHQVREAHVVVERHVAGGDLVEEGHLLMEVDAIDGLHREVVVPKQAVHAEQLHQREVPEQARRLVLLGGPVVLLGAGEVRLDLRALDQRLQVHEDPGGVEHLGVVLDLLDLLVALGLHGLAPVHAVGLVVVDELVQDVPDPLRGEAHREVVPVLEVRDDQVEELAVVLPRALAVIIGHADAAGEHVAVVQLLVEDEEERVARDLVLDRLHGGPLGPLVVLVGQLVEGVLVQPVDGGDVPLLQGLQQRTQEVVHGIRDDLPARGRRVVAALAAVLATDIVLLRSLGLVSHDVLRA
mmetsp:Transcript_15065/g.45155  ORF Transcript_15065/g.45155 Transcript_15065/m.45155 type:complete len:557 (-) Transcript_15065:46-1716(-)